MNNHDLKNKVAVITGGTRGIGMAIGLRLAQEGAKIAILGKTADPHPHLPGTIFTAAEEMKKAGGEALPIQTDIRHEEEVIKSMEMVVKEFGGIDILVNNASAISLTKTVDTTMKRYDLMNSVNVRGTFLCSKVCIPHLMKSTNPHILNISPPLSLDAKWYAPHVAYTYSKMGMSFCVLGMAKELKKEGIAVNALWPKTTIATAAIKNIVGGEEMMKRSRKPEIMADAAYTILIKDAKEISGQFFVDENILRDNGVTNFDEYAVDRNCELQPDFFL